MIRATILGAAAAAMFAAAAAASAPQSSGRPLPRPAPAEASVPAPLAASPLLEEGDAAPPLRPRPRPLRPGAEAPVAGAGAVPPATVLPAAAAAPRPRPRPADAAPATPSAEAVAAALPAAAAPPPPSVLRPRPRPAALPRPLSGPGAAPADLAAAGDSEAARGGIAVARAAALPAASAPAALMSPRPRPRPERLRREAIQLASAGAVRVQPGPGVAAGPPSGALCGIEGIQGRTLPRITSSVRGCGVENPVRVTAVAGVTLSQGAIMDCNTARALHRWVTVAAVPAVGNLGGGIAELQVAGHYVCRGRNGLRGAPISEHGRGKAIDISGIKLRNGELMTVKEGWRHPRYREPLRRMHRGACGIFGTTLGPGSDGHHEDHLHFDTASHRSGAYCR